MATITSNGHSSLRMEDEAGKVVYFDPFRIEEGNADADVIFITHSHYDHYDPESIEAVRKEGTLFVAPADVAADLRKNGEPDDIITEVVPAQYYEVDGISFKTVAAYNLESDYHPREKNWVGYVVELDGKRIYVAGDTDETPEALATICNTIIVPVGGTYTMNFEQAAHLVLTMNTRPVKAIPTHYGSVVGSNLEGPKFDFLLPGSIKVDLLYY